MGHDKTKKCREQRTMSPYVLHITDLVLLNPYKKGEAHG